MKFDFVFELFDVDFSNLILDDLLDRFRYISSCPISYIGIYENMECFKQKLYMIILIVKTKTSVIINKETVTCWSKIESICYNFCNNCTNGMSLA